MTYLPSTSFENAEKVPKRGFWCFCPTDRGVYYEQDISRQLFALACISRFQRHLDRRRRFSVSCVKGRAVDTAFDRLIPNGISRHAVCVDFGFQCARQQCKAESKGIHKGVVIDRGDFLRQYAV